MARIPGVTREVLNPEDRPIFDNIAESRGHVRGPYAILLHSPRLASCVAAIGAYLRFESELPDTTKEMAILVTAREYNIQYVFNAHVPLARNAGLSEEAIGSIAEGNVPRDLSGNEELVVLFIQELVRLRKISDATFDAVRDRFGTQGIVELAAIVGHYTLMGQIVAAFDVEPPPSATPQLPP